MKEHEQPTPSEPVDYDGDSLISVYKDQSLVKRYADPNGCNRKERDSKRGTNHGRLHL